MYEIVVGRSPKDFKKFGTEGTGYIAKHIVGKGDEAHLTNKVLIDFLRPHVILVAGKRGSGKCLDENTLITLGDGSVVPIKELEKKKNNVLGLNNKLKVKEVERTEFFKRKVDRLLEIRLRSGKKIRLTPEHPLLTIRGWKDAQELEIGSRIATPRKIGVFGNKPMKEYNVKLLAYLIAEGHLSNNFVLFSNIDQEIVKEFKNCVYDFDPNLKIETHSKEGCYRICKKNREARINRIVRNEKGQFSKGTSIPQKKNSIRLWLGDLRVYGELSRYKTIPQQIFQLPRYQLSIFLNRLFSCDGSIYKKKCGKTYIWQISYSSSSKILAQQVHHLLLRFGVLSKLRLKKVKCNNKHFLSYELVVTGIEVENFIENIGFFGEKESKQKLALEEIKKIKRNPNVDTIPKEVWELYKPSNWAELGRKFGYSNPKSMRTNINYGPSRQKLKRVAIAEDNYQLYVLANSDIFWDEIVEMREMKGECIVCDITVPGYHNFIANDIIVHNSYSGGTLAEEMALLPPELSQNLSTIMVDTMGIYWSMKYPNEDQLVLLDEWGLKPKGLEKQVKTYVPFKQKAEFEEAEIPVDFGISISPHEFTAEDWTLAFNLPSTNPIGLGLQKTVNKLQDSGEKFGLNDMITRVKDDRLLDTHVKSTLENMLTIADQWGVFGEQGIKIDEIAKPGTVNVFDVSRLRATEAWSVRNLLVAIICRKIYEHRVMARKQEELVRMGEIKLEKRYPMVWLIIDEAHQFVPAEGMTVSSGPILNIVKQGRQPGISFVPMTQMPNKIHQEVISQCDMVISHRLTSKDDLQSLQAVMQNYLMEDLTKSIDSLPKWKGSAIILDDNSERMYPVQVRPRFTWHGGESAIAKIK